MSMATALTTCIIGAFAPIPTATGRARAMSFLADPLPRCASAMPAVTEGDAGTSDLTVHGEPLERRPTGADQCATTGRTAALAGSDFIGVANRDCSLLLRAKRARPSPSSALGDTLFEVDETFDVVLSNRERWRAITDRHRHRHDPQR